MLVPNSFLNIVMRIIKRIATPVITFILLSLLLSFINWGCIQFIAKYCAPWGWHGPFINLLNLGSPLCILVNNIQVTLANYYIILWTSSTSAIILWISLKITPYINEH